MKFPNINRDDCPLVPEVGVCPADDNPGGGGDDGGGDDGGSSSLIIEPGFAILCDQGAIQFQTFLASRLGQQLLTAGLTYSSSDQSILVIDVASGAATMVGTGIVTVSVAWRNLTAAAQITCNAGDTDCCEETNVEIAVMRDVSKSMQQPNPAHSKFNVGYIVVKNAFAPTLGGILNGGKDSAARIDFSDTAVLVQPFTNDYNVYVHPGPPIPPGDTNIPTAFDLALAEFAGADESIQKVILIVSDGQNWVALTTTERAQLLQNASDFKTAGGLIICLGIAADEEGFALLQQLSSGGFFVNVQWSSLSGGLSQEAVDLIKGMLCLACAGSRTVQTGYGYGCDATMPGPQFPDSTFTDVESGHGGGDDGGGGDLPQLPSVQFTPGSGQQIGSGMFLGLNVPGHPSAAIRYVMTIDGSTPADPVFGGIGTDYTNPIQIDTLPSGGVAKIKAIGRESQWTDSLFSSAQYPEGSDTNGQPIIWNNDDMAPATPYPSSLSLSGQPGLITSVKVRLKDIRAQEVVPKAIVLQCPDGTAVMLLGADGSTNLYSNIINQGATITFDQAAAGELPIYGPPPNVVTGSYRPTVRNGFENVDFPLPAPTGPYATSLAAFNGRNPNGTWNLYVIDVNFYTAFGPNHIEGGWELILETA